MAYDKPYNNNRPQNNRPQGGYQNKPPVNAKPYEALNKDNYVQRAEDVIKSLGRNKLSTSQIRNILSMLNQIYNDVITTTAPTLSAEVQSQLQYLKVKLIYAAGRNQDVKRFMQESQIDQHLDHIDDSKEAFILYSRYMEALVAYHKFYNENA